MNLTHIFKADEPTTFHFIEGFIRIDKRVAQIWIYSLAYARQQWATEDVDNVLSNEPAREPKKRNGCNKDCDYRAAIVGVIVLK